jgi:hypothetical protein
MTTTLPSQMYWRLSVKSKVIPCINFKKIQNLISIYLSLLNSTSNSDSKVNSRTVGRKKASGYPETRTEIDEPPLRVFAFPTVLLA